MSKGKYVSSRGTKTKKPSEAGVPDIGEPDKYELFLRRADVIEVMLTLDIGNKKMRTVELMNNITRDELLYTGEYLGGAQHGMNRVFAASQKAVNRLPFYARARGNTLQIGRVSKVFEPKNYAIDGYEKPRADQRLRVEKWLKELADIGIVFEGHPLSNEEAHKLVEKIPAKMVADTEQMLKNVKEEYLKELERKDTADAEEVAEAEKAYDEHEQAEISKRRSITATRDGSKAESTGAG